MVQLIVGDKGKGKTKYILDKVNSEIQNTNGNIVYLDKSTKHMFELNNKVRLIDVSAYMLDGVDSFLGSCPSADVFRQLFEDCGN